jgi:hypothetical protein
MHPHPGAFFFAPTPFPWRHWVRVLPEAAALCPRFSLRLPIARLDSSRGFRQVTGVCPSEPLSEQLKTGVKSVDVDDRDCAPVAINRVRVGARRLYRIPARSGPVWLADRTLGLSPVHRQMQYGP